MRLHTILEEHFIIAMPIWVNKCYFIDPTINFTEFRDSLFAVLYVSVKKRVDNV